MFQGVGSSGPGLQLNATSYGTGAFIRVTIQILRDQGYNVTLVYVQQNLEPVVRCIEGSERSCWILQWADLWKNKVQVNQWPGARVRTILLQCSNAWAQIRQSESEDYYVDWSDREYRENGDRLIRLSIDHQRVSSDHQRIETRTVWSD